MGKKISWIILAAAAVLLPLSFALAASAENRPDSGLRPPLTPEQHLAKQPSMVNGQPLWMPADLQVNVNEKGFPSIDTKRIVFNICQAFKGDEKAGELATGGLVFLPNKVTHVINGYSARYTAESGADGTGEIANIVGSDLGDTLNVRLAALPAFMNTPALEKIGQLTFTFTSGYGDDMLNLDLKNDRAAITVIHTGGQDTMTVSGSNAKARLIIRGMAFDLIKTEDVTQDKKGHVQLVKFVMQKGTVTLQGENLNGFTVRAETGGAFIISDKGVTRDAAAPAVQLENPAPPVAPPAPETPAAGARMLRAGQEPAEEKGSPIVWKIKAAYDASRLGDDLVEQIRRLIAKPEKSPQTLESVLAALESKMGRRLSFHPPADLGIANIPAAEDPSCPPGKAVFDKAGQHSPDIPPGCKAVLVKAWGAGGGGVPGSIRIVMNGVKQPNGGSAGGSPGGFSAGIIALDGGKLDVIVGGGGAASTGVEGGKGGYNGGGNGGRGSRRENSAAGRDGFEQMGGGGGGGASMASLGGETRLIAGGGGGAGAQLGGLAGGGTNTPKFMQDYFRWIGLADPTFSIRMGQTGGAGIGGSAGKAFESASDAPENMAQIMACFEAPQDGQDLNGGNGGGSKELSCGDIGGGGGGAGYGGGGGGHFGDRGPGGGGGGLAPQGGVTLWGGLAGPANALDPDYQQSRGMSEQDGLVIVSWPAPEPAAFTAAVTKAIFVEKKNDE